MLVFDDQIPGVCSMCILQVKNRKFRTTSEVTTITIQ